MPSNADVETIEYQRPELQTVFDEFIKVIKWCGSMDKNARWFGFPAGLLAFSAIQAIGLFRDGRVRKEPGGNKKQFDMALCKYFPSEYYKNREKLWKRARCCLSHDLTVCGGVGISWDPNTSGQHLQEDKRGVLTVSMIELTRHLQEAMKGYLRDLDSDPCCKEKYNAAIREIENM